MNKLISNRWLLVLAMAFLAFSCDDEEAAPDPVASFQYEVDAANFLTIKFSNFSSDADTYSWDFGDGSALSTEENPSHTYAATGTYEVTLIASKGTKASAPKTSEVGVTDPNRALTLLAGTTSKTWKLYRVGTSMSVGPNADNPAGYWAGLTNNGTRPCLYNQTFTFKRDGGYVFDDKGAFWAEYGVFNNVANCNGGIAESCFDATVANMKNACGTDVSKWLKGTHSFTYNGSTGELTLNGLGAWIGIPKLGTTGESIVPVSQVKTKISITEKTGYDIMKVEFIYNGTYWPIYYASYSDASLEPALVTQPAAFGIDLTNITPTQMTHTFATANSFEQLASIGGASTITVGQTDPAAGGTNVGKFERVAGTDYQEAIIKVGGAASPDWKDVTWTNMTTVTMDVYLPSSNNYTTTLSKKVIIGLADQSATEQWWTKLIQYESAELALDQWVTVTFTLSSPTFASLGDTPAARNDLDVVFINIGGAGHGAGGTFYIRNLKFFKP